MAARVFLGLLVLLLADCAAGRFLEKLIEWPVPGAEDIVEVKRIFIIPRGTNGMWLVTVADPNKPQPLVIGEVKDTSNARHLVVDVNSTAYVADGYGGLLLFDVSNPQEPTRLSSMLMRQGDRADLVVSCGKYLYVFCSSEQENSMLVAEVKQEEAISVGRHSMHGRVLAAEQVDDKLLFAVTSTKYLLVIDGRKGAKFKFKSIIPLAHAATSICAFREFTYVGVKSEIRVYFTLNPSELELAVTLPLSADIKDLKWFAGMVFAATEGGLSVVDVRDPRRPFEAGFVSTPPLKKVEVLEFVAYVLTEEDKMIAIDCRNPVQVNLDRPTEAPFKQVDDAAPLLTTGVETFPPLGFDTSTLQEGAPAWRDMRESVFLDVPKHLIGAQLFLTTSLIKRGFQIKFRCADLVCQAVLFVELCVPCSTGTNGGLPNILTSSGWTPSSCSVKFQLVKKGVVHNTVLFHKQIRKGDVAFVSHLTKDAMFVGMAMLPRDMMCADVPREEDCLDEKLCSWNEISESCVPSLPCPKRKHFKKMCITCGANELSVKTQQDKV